MTKTDFLTHWNEFDGAVYSASRRILTVEDKFTEQTKKKIAQKAAGADVLLRTAKDIRNLLIAVRLEGGRLTKSTAGEIDHILDELDHAIFVAEG